MPKKTGDKAPGRRDTSKRFVILKQKHYSKDDQAAVIAELRRQAIRDQNLTPDSGAPASNDES